MDDSSPLTKEENTSNSFAESDDKSIKSPIFQESDGNDSEVERSDNENESINDNVSESNEAPEPDQNEEDSISVQSKAEEEAEEGDAEEVDAEEADADEADAEEAVAEEADAEEEEADAEEEADNKDNEDENSSIKDSAAIEQSDDKNQISDDSDNDNADENESKEQQSDDEEEEIWRKKKKVTNEIFGDSDSEDDYKVTGKKRKLDSEASDKDEDSEEEFFNKKKKIAIVRDSDNENDSDEDVNQDKKQEDNDEADEKEKDLTEANEESGKEILPNISSDSSDDELEDKRSNKHSSDLVYDFDIMMAKRKEQNARNRKRKNTDLINDSDDFIADLLNRMKQAAEDDFELNKERKAATCKMKLLPEVVTHLRKIDLRESFLDSGALGVITDWLTQLPDRSLPNLQVRESLLKILLELNIMDVERLKSSSVGKAVMYLFKHPKETKENKRLAAKLISNWSRPIFNCETDYHSISKEDREERDYANMQKMRKMSSEASSSQSASTNNAQPILKPGDKGWVPRARVPLPSTKDYVVRPKSTVEIEMSRTSRKQVSRLDKHLRNFQEKKRSSKMQRAVKISIEGRKV